MGLQLITAPSSPFTLATVRDDHLKVTSGTAENTYIQTLIDAAVAMGERLTRRAWMTQVWELTRDCFPYGLLDALVIPKPPLQSITFIKYTDVDGVQQTWSSSKYVVSNVGDQRQYGIVRLAYGETWPVVRYQPDAVTIRFSAGYPESGSPLASVVPVDLQQAALLIIGEMYKQRSESVIGGGSVSPAVIRAMDIFQEYRVF